MSTDAFKKRRVEGGHHHEGGDSASAATEVDSGVTLAAIMAKMNEMETRNISMQNEMDSKTATMQNEIIGMKTRLAQFDEMEARCEHLERSMKILIKEQKWEYSAPDIPTSHWIARGYDEDYIEDMEECLGDIKIATCYLRNGEVNDEEIILGRRVSETALLHDDLLLPHWEELVNAMQLCQEGKPSKLSINNLQLSTSIIDLLMPVLKYKSFEEIELQNNSFINVREGIEFAVEVLKSNEMMRKFYWLSNTINSMEDALYLVEAVTSHPTIDKIRLDHCLGGNFIGYDILCSLLTSDKNFTEIDLDDNNIRTGGGTVLSDYLATNPPLKDLDLRNNNLNDENARLIARALKRNTNLQILHLYDNDITEVGYLALIDAVYDPTSLNSMSDCNHTCRINILNWSDDIPSNLSGYTQKQNRARKLCHLLSVRNREGTNVRHLNLEFGDENEDDDALKLVPRVLESMNHYSRLSVVYEILRGWKMPELYELR